MQRFRIREIHPEDNKRLEQVIRSCLVEIGQDHDGTIWTDPMLGELSREYSGEGIRYWVVENGSGDISGGVGIGRIESSSEVCELQKFYCLPELRGTGAAQALMETALGFARQHYAKCYIETFDNTIAAQKLYERNGFVRTDVRYGATGHYACNILYIKDLKKGDVSQSPAGRDAEASPAIFRYETHCHTSPVSRCAKASVEDTVRFYRKYGYDGLFITNHFLDGNINPAARELSYRDQIDFYFHDYEEAVRIGSDAGIKVFPGVELSYKGTDFLIYGLDKEWYKAHPEILEMQKTEELPFMMEAGALVIQAHPYREAHNIDDIRLYPRSVHGVEVINSNQARESNEMAEPYAEQYGFLKTAGSDNHWGRDVFSKLTERGFRPQLAGMCSNIEINSVQDFIDQVRGGMMSLFLLDENGNIQTIDHTSAKVV